MAAAWQSFQKLTVPAAGTQTFTINTQAPVERLTIWAVSSNRVLTNMTFQVQVNGVNYNTAVNVTAAVAADVVYRSGGASADDDILPVVHARQVAAGIDPFVLSVLVSNAGGAPESVTLMAVGLQHQG